MTEVKTESDGHEPSRHVCPRCGRAVYKVHRTAGDRMFSVFYSVGRYRCRAEGCGWQGLLPRDPSASWPPTRSALSRTAWIVAGALLIPLVGLSVAILWIVDEHTQPVPAAPARAIAEPLPEPPSPRQEGPGPSSELPNGCVWKGPGESPYFGTLATALAAARLPDEIVRKFEIMRDGRFVTDRLEITSAGIRTADQRRHFGNRAVAMAMGETVCLGTTISPPPGKMIAADLYELVDDANRRFLIAIVADGGNVAVLEE
jgi:hypothetical protein